MARSIPVFIFLLLSLALADDIATNTPVPPLQWINLTNLLQGNSPPPLKDAAIGYDETRYLFFFLTSLYSLTDRLPSRSIILFGGESQGGFPQGQTYLYVFILPISFCSHSPILRLNLDSLTWDVPSPPSGLHRTPPARSAALAGEDFAASKYVGLPVIYSFTHLYSPVDVLL